MNQKFTEFVSRFNFQPALEGYLGVERERFFMMPNGLIVPRAVEFLQLASEQRFTYELSACQIEDITEPCLTLEALEASLRKNDADMEVFAKKLGVGFAYCEVAPEDLNLTIYPDMRYLTEVVPRLSLEQLSAACRVAGTHVHIGMRSLAQAIRVYNALAQKVQELLRIGDHSNGLRLKLYETVIADWHPPVYENEQHFYDTGVRGGFEGNPRDCWHMVRISRHGTVEVRAFGTTPDVSEIIGWARTVRAIAREV